MRATGGRSTLPGASALAPGLCAAVLLLAACAAAPVPEAGFAPLVAQFAAEARARGYALDPGRVEVGYGQAFPAAAVASCYATPFGSRRVVVNRAVWSQIPAQCREIFVFHELGHCVLNRVHANELRADGTPTSLMNYATVACGLYRARRDTYLDELFTPVP